jgi:hydrogenase nickel incorporation protein HypA/HybF
MHEMSLAESVLQIIEDSVRNQHVNRVRSVVLEIGALSAVEPDAMRFCFEAVTRGSIANGAQLEIIMQPGQASCMACGAVSILLADRFDLCPECQSARILITGGDAMRVKELAVE